MVLKCGGNCSDFHGGGAMIRLAGQQQLLDFPACQDLKTLNSHLDAWLSHMETYGEGIDSEMAFTMLMKIIPQDIRKDILRRRELQEMPLPDLVEHIKSQSTWLRSEVLVQNILKDTDHAQPISMVQQGAPPPCTAIYSFLERGQP